MHLKDGYVPAGINNKDGRCRLLAVPLTCSCSNNTVRQTVPKQLALGIAMQLSRRPHLVINFMTENSNSRTSWHMSVCPCVCRYGTGIDRSNACYDTTKTVVVMITDTCKLLVNLAHLTTSR